jgi:signal transduction histidine kinase
MKLPVDTKVEDAMRALSRVGGELLESYGALERRAERVEEELSLSNAELERKLAELSTILEALPTGVIVRDAERRVVRTNDAAREILGSQALEGGREHPLLDGASDLQQWCERDLVREDGRRLVLASRSTLIDEADEGAVGSVQILDDRTELVELSERLHGLDKLAALGNMAGGIAHEIRNPMNAVKGFAALLSKRLEPGSTEHEWAQLIVEGVDEADLIISSMQTLAAPERLVREGVDGAELVTSAVELAVASLPEEQAGSWSVEHECSLAQAFEADRIKLRQAIRNMIANAVDAQPEGGRVHVSLALEADEVVVRVTDAGPGIPAELRRRVLDPFFTTRAQGTGLGLALVGTIAQLHGGRVDVSPLPAPLGGADVSLRIPFRPAA